jgi:NitT/TauT family transport system substrate-binding protein
MVSKNAPTSLLLFAVAVFAACGMHHSAHAQSPPALRHVSVRLNFLPGVEHAFLYLGKQKGWYAEQGIDLEVAPGQGSTVAVKTVGSGEDQFAIADTGSVARGWEAGVPLLYVAMLLKHTPAVIFSSPSRNIVAMRDLCGKRVGINLRSTTAEQYHAMVRLAKLDCSIEEIPISSGGSKEVVTNAVDAAVNFSYTDALRVKLNGGVNMVPATQFFDFFSLGFITNQKFLADNKDLAHRFLSVAFRSLGYSFDHKDEAMDAFFKIVPEADRAYESAKFDMFKKLAQDDDADHGVGPQSREAWEATMRSLRDVGLTRSVLSVDGKVSDAAIR